MGRRLLRTFGRFPTRHPWRTIAAWSVVLVVLAAIGRNAPTSLHKIGEYDFIGKPAAEALQLERAKFGHDVTTAILLAGTPAEIQRHGPRVVRALRRIEAVTTMGPWSAGAPAALTITPGKVLLLARSRSDAAPAETGRELVPKIKHVLAAELPRSVTARVTGVPALDGALYQETFDATARAERVAIPALLIVLLLIFRSPIAALMPLAMGVPVIAAGSGVMTLIDALLFRIDVISLSLLSLVGLALGVDYSLLVVSRFREELAKNVDPAAAVTATMATAGRTVTYAGTIVTVAMAVIAALMLEPAGYSSALAAIVACILSLLLATTLLPAILTLTGPRIDRWRVGRRSARPVLAPLVRRLTRRPGIVTAVALVPLLLLAIPAIDLDTGPPTIDSLRQDNPAVRDYEEVASVVGAGWSSPYEIVATSSSGPITSRRNLAALAGAEQKLEQDPDVGAVIGPGAIYEESRDLFATASDVEDAGQELAAARRTLGAAHRRAARLRSGLRIASSRAQAVAQTTQAASAPSDALGTEARRAALALDAIDSGLATSAEHSDSLKADAASIERTGQRALSVADTAAADSGGLSGLAEAFKAAFADGETVLAELSGVPDAAQGELERARAALGGAELASKTDPHVAAALEAIEQALAVLSGVGGPSNTQISSGYHGLAAALDKAAAQNEVAVQAARDLSQGTRSLVDGVGEIGASQRLLEDGASRTRTGTAKLSKGVTDVGRGKARLKGGLLEIAAGAGRLTDGLGQIGKGARRLRSGLERGRRKTRSLGSAARQADRAAGDLAGGARGAAVEVDAEKAAESGYATLAALSGASPDRRQNASYVVNTDRGADAARLFVLPRSDPLTGDDSGLQGRLAAAADRLGKRMGDGRAVVGGRANAIVEFRSISEGRKLTLMVLLAVVTFAFLTVVFRSVLLAAKAVFLNMLVVGAAFGVVALSSNGPDPLLGGPGWMDIIAFFATYGIVFALSIDYEIFMINRMREAYLATDSNEAAIEYGVAHTARVVTGAAAVMVAVFVAFAIFGAVPIRQLGLALSVAVAVDATIVRLILLPATMRLFGKANWWLPGWLERRLPRLAI